MFLNNRGSSLIFVVSLAIILNIVFATVYMTISTTQKKTGVKRLNTSSVLLAEAGKEKLCADLRNSTISLIPNQRKQIYTNYSLGKGSFSVSCSTNSTVDTVYMTSTGSDGLSSVTIDVIANIEPDAVAWKKWIRGAITARTAVDLLGNIEVDGRDYDTTGGLTGTLLTPVSGTYGVSSGDLVNAGGSSQIGGQTTAPTSPKIQGVTVNQNIDLTGYPTTPEEVLGLAPGALDKYKTSICPPSNYYGIVYTDKSCEFAGGILICHNAAGTASLGNYHGNFKGLIIADEDKHINGGATVLGAVIFLGKSAGGNCIGNGGATIHYSSRMLEKTVNSLLGLGGKRNVTVISWSERR